MCVTDVIISKVIIYRSVEPLKNVYVSSRYSHHRPTTPTLPPTLLVEYICEICLK